MTDVRGFLAADASVSWALPWLWSVFCLLEVPFAIGSPVH